MPNSTGANSVSVIDAATNTVVATIVAATPFGSASVPDGSHVYVASAGGNVFVIDLRS
ncbi:MAG TPA: hypothetical protein VLH77_06185 [Gammaproteobacteria bacterium]|nr:hypothetical protein [Gammaproteobacteria bacterium]